MLLHTHSASLFNQSYCLSHTVGMLLLPEHLLALPLGREPHCYAVILATYLQGLSDVSLLQGWAALRFAGFKVAHKTLQALSSCALPTYLWTVNKPPNGTELQSVNLHTMNKENP